MNILERIIGKPRTDDQSVLSEHDRLRGRRDQEHLLMRLARAEFMDKLTQAVIEDINPRRESRK